MGLRGHDDPKIHRQRRRGGAPARADVQGSAEAEALGAEEVHKVLQVEDFYHQWIGLREDSQESPIFNGKINVFL